MKEHLNNTNKNRMSMPRAVSIKLEIKPQNLGLWKYATASLLEELAHELRQGKEIYRIYDNINQPVGSLKLIK